MKTFLFIWLLVTAVVADDSHEDDDSGEIVVVHESSSVPFTDLGAQKALSAGPLGIALSSHSVHPTGGIGFTHQQFPQQVVSPVNFAYNSLLTDGIGYTQQPVSGGFNQDQYTSNVFQQPLTGYTVQTSSGGAKLVPDGTFSPVSSFGSHQQQQQGFDGTYGGVHQVNVPYPAQSYSSQQQVVQVPQFTNFAQQPSAGYRFSQSPVPYPYVSNQVQNFRGVSSVPQYVAGSGIVTRPVFPLVASHQFPGGYSFHASGVSSSQPVAVGQTADPSVVHRGQQQFGPVGQTSTFSQVGQFGGVSPSTQFGSQVPSSQFGVQTSSVNQFGSGVPSTQFASHTPNQFGSPSFVSSGPAFGAGSVPSFGAALPSSSVAGTAQTQSSFAPTFYNAPIPQSAPGSVLGDPTKTPEGRACSNICKDRFGNKSCCD